MGSIELPKSPNIFHPEKPSAVGSRNSLAQEFRDQQAEVFQDEKYSDSSVVQCFPYYTLLTYFILATIIHTMNKM